MSEKFSSDSSYEKSGVPAGDPDASVAEESVHKNPKRKLSLYAVIAGVLILGAVVGASFYKQNVSAEAARVGAENAAAASSSKAAASRKAEEAKMAAVRERQRKADAAKAASASASAQVIEDAEAKGWTHIADHVFYGENNTDCNRILSCVSLMLMSPNDCPRGIRATVEFTNKSGDILFDTVYRSTGPLTAGKQAVLEFVTTSTPELYDVREAVCR